MINLVRNVEECRSPTVPLAELIRCWPEVVLDGRGIDAHGQPRNSRDAIELMRVLGPDC